MDGEAERSVESMLGILHVSEEVGEVDNARQVRVSEGNAEGVLEHAMEKLSRLGDGFQDSLKVLCHALRGEILASLAATFEPELAPSLF